MKRYAVLFAGLLLLVPSSAIAQVLLDESGEFGPEPSSEIRRFAVEVQESAEVAILATTVKVTQGKVTVRATDPEGERVVELSTTGSMQVGRQRLNSTSRIGTYDVYVVPEEAVGTWSVRVSVGGAAFSQVAIYLVPGVGMVVVGLAAVLLWRVWSRAKWRWFWVGAAVWAVGVALKVAFAVPLNKPILGAIDAVVSRDVYLALGGVYIGLLTGVFEEFSGSGGPK